MTSTSDDLKCITKRIGILKLVENDTSNVFLGRQVFAYVRTCICNISSIPFAGLVQPQTLDITIDSVGLITR